MDNAENGSTRGRFVFTSLSLRATSANVCNQTGGGVGLSQDEQEEEEEADYPKIIQVYNRILSRRSFGYLMEMEFNYQHTFEW